MSLGRIESGRALAALAAGAVLAGGCAGEFPQTTFRPVSEYGEALNAVFTNTFWWTMFILVLVQVLVVYVVLRFRERPNQPPPPQIHGNTKLELLWTIIPAIIVILISVPTVRTIFETQRRPAEDALEIEVIGHQWWWEYRYPEYGVVTANEFHLPIGREIHFRIRSADVIHSFWIPRLGGKRDANPVVARAEGERAMENHIVLTVSEPGRYRGQCAEFCGESHGIMATTAVAVSPEEFDAWVASMQDAGPPPAPAQPATVPGDTSSRATANPPTPQAAQVVDSLAALPPTDVAQEDPLIAQGRQIFTSRACVACHAIANTNARGTLGPNLTRFGSRPYVGAGAKPNTIEHVEAWIRDPQSLKPGALMPGTQTEAAGMPPTGLTDEEVRAVAAYLVSLK